ncbi:MAG TPA: hypothetical protein VF644_10150 [Pyrinomonadaceae bacterium]
MTENDLINQIVEAAFNHLNLRESGAISNYAFYEKNVLHIVNDITKDYTPEGTPFVRFRLKSSDTLMFDSVYFPASAVAKFFTQARLKADGIFEDEDLRRWFTVQQTILMTAVLLFALYHKLKLSLEITATEVLSNFEENVQKGQDAIESEKGRKTKKTSFKDKRDELFENYKNQVSEFWRTLEEATEMQKKVELAEVYPSISKHWKAINTLLQKDFPNWRDYAKTGEFADTPDDLLEKLWDTEKEKLSVLAIEHAARRVGLIKPYGVEESVLEARKRGFKATGYSTRRLFSFLEEGERQRKLSAPK